MKVIQGGIFPKFNKQLLHYIKPLGQKQRYRELVLITSPRY